MSNHKITDLATLAAIAFVGAFAVTTAIAAPTFSATVAATPTAALLANVDRVCAPNAFVLSDKAKLACLNGTFPRLAKTGDAFVNVGVGVELNVLIRQLTATASN